MNGAILFTYLYTFESVCYVIDSRIAGQQMYFVFFRLNCVPNQIDLLNFLINTNILPFLYILPFLCMCDGISRLDFACIANKFANEQIIMDWGSVYIFAAWHEHIK